ncbi:MAG: ABC transporter permease [Bdellovibrionia bacterium]
MKKLFIAFCRRNLAFSKLAIVTNLEYRLNYFTDAILQPVLTVGIEMLLWYAVFAGAQTETIGGFTRDYYLAYALWAAFFSRIATSWMYEYRMIQEIDTGSINSLIVRPVTFYEYYFSQLMGYKIVTTFFSLIPPVLVILFFDLPTDLTRFPMAVAMVLYYLVLVHSISFVIASSAFFLNKVYSFTAAKNLLLWLLTGELFPLDLLPSPLKEILLALPFASGVFTPVAYLTGRTGIEAVWSGFLSITIGIVVVNMIGIWMWKQGLRRYAGTGA